MKSGFDIDWDVIKTFHAVVRTGSFLGAAKVINVNQGTVSRRIASLEEVVGTPLFIRNRIGVSLTEEGCRLAAAADEVNLRVDYFVRVAIGLRRRNVITVQAPEGTLTYVLQPLFNRYPGPLELPVSSTPLPPVRAISDQVDEPADVMVLWAPEGEEPDHLGVMEVEPVAQTTFHPFVAPGYYKGHRVPRNFADLKNHDLLSVSIYEQMRFFPWQDLVHDARRPPLVVDWTPSLVPSLLAGSGIALLPTYADRCLSSRIKQIDLDYPPMRAGIWLAAEAGNLRDPAVRTVYDAMKSVLGMLSEPAIG